MNKTFTIEINDKGVGTLLFDLPGEKINKLSAVVLTELDAVLDDKEVLRELSRELDGDMAASQQVELAAVRKLDWRLSLLHYLRYWM